ncbi:PTS system cellobiose-specific IIC component [Enterococcus sp. PF1-24]|uniref:PTS sugar transporter subunit IIC n=1 Tax=unclassified Enterococcus TaxID=2608891 RepID=UPI00247532AA|nr:MULTISPECIES: PTS sugar transporter subunit IIC [unclassified Enterococcus]MDH6364463.1 PTS system cellobiose-specific IIC component [Enterococcus sp. PFB1-1]MDH6401514.1 PTS system cellobiose-specific IIC component [Enterococcus sp. PF1-24]
MDAFTSWLERHVLPIAAKIGSEKHLVALRDAFIGMMPATMAGAIAVLLNAFVRDFPKEYIGEGNAITKFCQPLISVNGLVWGGTLAIMAVIFSVSFGYNIAKAYDVDPLSGALVSLVAFIMGIPQTATANIKLSTVLDKSVIGLFTEAGAKVTEVDGVSQISADAWGYFPFSKYMGGSGLFTAIIFGFISVIIFAKLMKKNIIIKMPDSVPPAVSKAFAAIIPGIAGLYVSGTIYYVFQKVAGMPLIDWISESIQKPLLGLSQGYLAVFIIVLLVHVLWFFGLHGTNIMGAVLQSIYGVAMTENTNAYQMKEAIPYKWVAGSFEAFVWPGGAGVTLMLLVAVLLFSKRADYLTVAKLGIGPGLFNINEPVMFGMPIVLNPIFMVPFIVAPIVTASIAYFATLAGLVNPVVVSVIWVMPAGLSGFLATGGDWRAIVLTIVNLAVALAIWAPFVIAANKLDPAAGEE